MDSYGPPPGFCFDRECLDEPIMDQAYLEEYNAVERVNEFVEYVKRQVFQCCIYFEFKKEKKLLVNM